MVPGSDSGREFTPEFNADGSWYESVNVGALGEDVRRKIERELLRRLKRIADSYSIQYALLWYLYLQGSSLEEIYKVYRILSGKLVSQGTVRKQIAQLKRKGLVKHDGGKYIALVDPRDVEDLFDRERSRAGRIGASIRHMRINSRSLKISPGLKYYVERVVEESKKLVKRGKRDVALDLIAHTLLPLRENEILWLWHQDIFIYYSPKVKGV